MADYSILTSSKGILDGKEDLAEYLRRGVKLIAFGSASALEGFPPELEPYQRAHLLQLYPVPEGAPEVTIRNGRMDGQAGEKLEELSRLAPQFNIEQYRIEHADADKSLIVEAGAGTGKTTVMIDRILFLLRMVPELKMEEIGLITFTNEATDNMKKKIQAALMERYALTRLPEYLTALEGSSKLHIQTIHSFSRGIISELGASLGYSQKLALQGLKYERKQIVDDVLDEQYRSDPRHVRDSLGAPLYKLDKLLLQFWDRLESLGLTDEEMGELDWGEAEKDSQALHNALRASFGRMNGRYQRLKLERDAIAVGDIVRELRRILRQGEDLKIKTLRLKYLFVDEFQDSDNAQIEAIAWLQRSCGLKLFAVGDVKQSIYRFRGAVETAFGELRGYLRQSVGDGLEEFTLSRNYRTSKDVLDALHPIFSVWGQKELLDYRAALVPQRRHPGSLQIEGIGWSEDESREAVVAKLRELLKDHGQYMASVEDKDGASHHVTVLTRTNADLQRIGRWCAEAEIPCYIKREGTFFSAPAVRDFFSLVKAYVFPTSTTHLYDYLDSAYGGAEPPDDLALSRLAPGSAEQLDYLRERLDTQGMEVYARGFRLKPVLAVLRQIVDERRPAERYVARRKTELRAKGSVWEEEGLAQQLALEASQYEADLEKLMGMLRRQFADQMVSLYQVYTYLALHIATDREEDEPDVSGAAGYGCVYGMTVHKAKGLEFDTVLIPFTGRPFRKDEATELLIDESATPKRVGWCWLDKADKRQSNGYYDDLAKREMTDVDREEARLLYVAMTRAIRRLVCFVKGKGEHSWSYMLQAEEM